MDLNNSIRAPFNIENIEENEDDPSETNPDDQKIFINTNGTLERSDSDMNSPKNMNKQNEASKKLLPKKKIKGRKMT